MYVMYLMAGLYVLYVYLHFGNLTIPQKDFLKAVGKVCVIGARNL